MSQPQVHNNNNDIEPWIRNELQPFLRQYFDRGQGSYDTFDDEVQPIRRLLELLAHLDSHPFDLVHALQAITVPGVAPLYPAIGAIAQDPRTVIALIIWYQLRHDGLSLRNSIYYRGFPLPAQGVGSPDFQNAVWTARSDQAGATCPRCGYAGPGSANFQGPTNPGQAQDSQPQGSSGNMGSSTTTGRSKKKKRGRGRAQESEVPGLDGAIDDDDGKELKSRSVASAWSRFKKFFKRRSKDGKM